MIERGELPRELVGVGVGGRARDREAEVVGDLRHRGNDELRVARRRLNRLLDGRLAVVAVHVVDPAHVGEEDRVEAAAFGSPGDLGPVLAVGVLRRSVARVRPRPGRDVLDRGHGEEVEMQMVGHRTRYAIRG